MAPHELTKNAFIAAAQAEALVGHGRKWNVTLGAFSAFSDADTAEAAKADVHHAAVNNALFFNSPDAQGLSHRETMPSIKVLVDYLDLVDAFNVKPIVAGVD